MTAEPYAYTDLDGDLLHVGTGKVGLHVSVKPDLPDLDDVAFAVCIPGGDVRNVTAVMHEKAGLPDRWVALRVWLGARMDEFEGGSACSDPDLAAVRYARSLDYRAALRHMDELEAGR